MHIRELTAEELDSIWTIDRTETIERIYHHVNGELVLRQESWEVHGWPPDDRQQQAVLLSDCFERGGTFLGAFEGERLVGVAVLENRFIGRESDQLQLKFLHVSREHRGKGTGSMLFRRSVERARELGAVRLYVSATPSENTVNFYLNRGCRVTKDVDPDLFALEPEDIHLEFAVRS